MKRKFLKQLLVYSVCACMTFLAIPVLAESTPTIISSEKLISMLGNREVPVSWNRIDEAYMLNCNNKTLDISSLPQTEEVKPTIQIPSGVSSIAIKGDSTKTYNLSIIVSSRITPLNIIIKDLKIQSDRTGIDVTGNTNITNLIVTGENSIVSNKLNGIAVYTGNNLVIDADTNGSKLIIVAGENCAGIGGRFYAGEGEVKKGNGKITINGGTIHVVGGNNAAAIGSATDEVTDLEDIEINGGVITAIGGNGGAGIGSGRKQNKNAGKIVIHGGTINATGKDGGAGIGGGAQNNGGKVFDIIIEAGNIDAQGDNGGAGIGGGALCHASDITIIGGTIRAVGSDNVGGKGGAGIGGGSERGFKTIIIGDVDPKKNNPFIEYAKGGKEAAGIGTGGQGQATGDETIKLLDGIIGLAQGDGGAAGIGGGYQRGFKEIIIGNTQVQRAFSTGGGAGIGTGNEGSTGEGKNIIVIQSPLYAGAENYNGRIINAIGGGYSRDGHSKVVLESEVFTSNDKVGVIDTDNSLEGLKIYAFECYREDRTTRIGTGLNFSIKSNADPNLALHPDNYTDGTIYGYLKDIGDNTLGEGTDYYMEIIDETGKTYYAEQFERHTEGHKTIIKMAFVEKIFANVLFNTNTVESSKIIPFSTSNIDFVTNLKEDISVVNKPFPDEIKSGEVKIDFNKLASDITPFDLSDMNKIKFMVYRRDGFESNGSTPRYSYDASLTGVLNSSVSANVSIDNTNKNMTIKYPNELLNYGEYKIRILVPNSLNKQVNQYIAQNVKTSILANQNKEVAVTISYTIKTYITIDGGTRSKEQQGTITDNIKARYHDLVKIN